MRFFNYLSVFFVAALLLLPNKAQALTEPPADLPAPHVTISLIPERTHVMPGETIKIAIDQNIDAGWHTYWVNPGDSGQTMTVDWTLPQGFTTGELHWPVPMKIAMGPVLNYGYSTHAVLLQDLTVPQELPTDGPVTISADISLLVCSDICIPEHGTYSVTLNDGTDIDNSAIIKAAQTWLPEVIDGNAFYKEDGDNIDVAVMLDSANIKSGFDILPVEWGIIDNSAETDSELIERNEILIHKKHGERPLAEMGPLEMLITYSSPAPGAFLVTAHPDLNAFAQAERAKNAPAGLGLTLLAALLGGLILNLMPCVFPVLSIKALSLCAMKDKEIAQARKYGIFYTAGVLASFGLLAGILLGMRAAGEQIGWGFQLQNPIVVLLLADLLFMIGLNFSGMFELTGAFTNLGHGLTRKDGSLGSFFTGVLAAVVATPCTAPFMGAALGAALLHPGPAAILIFLALGFGLALPYLLLCFVPALRHCLPRPGKWMQVMREVLAFPMYASAAWLVWVYSQQTGADGVMFALAGFIGLAFSLWLLRHSHVDGMLRIFVRLLAAFTLVGSLLIAFVTTSAVSVGRDALPVSSTMNEIHFTQDTLDSLLAGPRPVFVNMTAAWCITCKANEKIALGTRATREMFEAQNVAYLKGDWTNRNAEITSYLAQFGRNGVPIYVYYAPPLENGKRPQPVILPQLLTESILNDTIGGGTDDDD